MRQGEYRVLAGTIQRLAVFAMLPLLSVTCVKAQVIEVPRLSDVLISLDSVSPPVRNVVSAGDVLQPVTDVVPPVTDVVQPVTDVVQPVTDVVQPVTDVVQPVTDVVPPIAVPLPVIQTPEGGLPIVQLPLPGCTGDIAACLPGTVLNLAGLPSGVIDLVGALPEAATGLLLQQTAALSQVVSGLTGTIASNLANVVLDLGLIDTAAGGPGGGVVSSPFATSTSAAPLSMFIVSGVKKLSHDGFDATSVFGNGATPAFEETDYGLTLGARWDASRHFDLAPNTFTLGVIGNYTHTDIDFGTNAALAPFIDKTGSADIDSWSVGTFGLITDGRKYGLFTLNATFGSPETENFALASTAEYNTFGIAATALSGVLIPVGGATTLDLRGGFTFVSASGDDFTDSAGVRFRDAQLEEISGEISARLFQVMRLESGTLRPFIQGGLSQRLHYSNEVEVEGVRFAFEEADTTLFARAGVDFDIDRSLQAYLAVRGDVSDTTEAIAVQVGLTFKID